MKTKQFSLIIFLFASGIFVSVFGQDVITLKNGDEIQAIVNEVDLGVVKYKRFDNQAGPTYSLDKTTVFMIKYKNGTKDVFGAQTEPKKEVTTPAPTPATTAETPKVEPVQTPTPVQTPPPALTPVTDFDGNTYQTVTIGSQVWMAENLKTTHFSNGDPIPLIQDNAWSTQNSAAMCFYENNPVNKDLLGGIYNWWAISDTRNIAPAGWRVPTEADWATLIDNLGGENEAGGKLKEEGTTHWASPNQGATNESGFTALPGGGRYDNGKFDLKGYFGIWATSPENNDSQVWYRSLDWNSTKILNHHDGSKNGGGSIRCVRIAPAVAASVSVPNQSVSTTAPVNPMPIQGGRGGVLKIFSELPNSKIYIDDKLQGVNVKQINDIPIGSHYVKVMYDNIVAYGEVLDFKDGVTTTILVKNSQQVQEKVLNSKVQEQEQYKQNKLDILLSRGSSTTTKGYSNLFPGYYGYWGTSTATSTTVETTDWKIIQGGVKEISESTFATLTNNKRLQDAIAKQWKSYNSVIGTTAIIGLVTLIPTGLILADMINTGDGKPSFLFENNAAKTAMTQKGSDAQTTWFVICAVPCLVSCTICLRYPEPKGHKISVEDAANDAQLYNKNLKVKLGLPDYYEPR